MANVAVTAGAAAAAAEAARVRGEEEEELTPYSDRDLHEGWEFKIMRSSSGQFKRPDVLRAMLDAEAEAGWVLVEKFDDTRVRLKRPASYKNADAKLEFDPYRTVYGATDTAVALAVLAAILIGLALIVGTILIFKR